jgi:hypothetical protein
VGVGVDEAGRDDLPRHVDPLVRLDRVGVHGAHVGDGVAAHEHVGRSRVGAGPVLLRRASQQREDEDGQEDGAGDGGRRRRHPLARLDRGEVHLRLYIADADCLYKSSFRERRDSKALVSRDLKRTTEAQGLSPPGGAR